MLRFCDGIAIAKRAQRSFRNITRQSSLTTRLSVCAKMPEALAHFGHFLADRVERNMNGFFLLAKKISQKDFLRKGAAGVKGKKRLKAVSLKRRLAATWLTELDVK